MPITAKELDLGASIEQLRQEFNNLVVDVSTLQASPTYGESLIFEGASDDQYETYFTVQDPTADRTISLPNKSGTLATTDDTSFPESTTFSGTTPCYRRPN